jgi:hypothetical protein
MSISTMERLNPFLPEVISEAVDLEGLINQLCDR